MFTGKIEDQLLLQFKNKQGRGHCRVKDGECKGKNDKTSLEALYGQKIALLLKTKNKQIFNDLYLVSYFW